jgi:hypothetical protein
MYKMGRRKSTTLIRYTVDEKGRRKHPEEIFATSYSEKKS